MCPKDFFLAVISWLFSLIINITSTTSIQSIPSIRKDLLFSFSFHHHHRSILNYIVVCCLVWFGKGRRGFFDRRKEEDNVHVNREHLKKKKKKNHSGTAEHLVE